MIREDGNMGSICLSVAKKEHVVKGDSDMRLFCNRSSVRTNQKACIVQLIIKSDVHLIPLFLQGSVGRPD